MGEAASLPRVGYLALGGTIASVPARPGEPAQPGLSAADIAQAVSGLDGVAHVVGEDLARVGSVMITVPDLLRVRDRAAELVDGGAVGVVVSQGTDSIEETSYALDLLWDRPEPLVVTGAMRHPSLLGAEGPANLMAAVRVAAAASARDLGVLVCLSDEVHAARFVRKTHTTKVSTFASPGLGPLGWLSEDRVVIPLRLQRSRALAVPSDGDVPAVALVTQSLGDDGRLLHAVADGGFAGLVVAGMGGGHVRAEWVEPLRRLAQHIPVVLTSRAGSGEVLEHTYGYPGAEVELLAAGLLRAGHLDPPKARVRLVLGLMAGLDPASLFPAPTGAEPTS